MTLTFLNLFQGFEVSDIVLKSCQHLKKWLAESLEYIRIRLQSEARGHSWRPWSFRLMRRLLFWSWSIFDIFWSFAPTLLVLGESASTLGSREDLRHGDQLRSTMIYPKNHWDTARTPCSYTEIEHFFESVVCDFQVSVFAVAPLQAEWNASRSSHWSSLTARLLG